MQIINRALTLNYQLKKRDLISTDLVITGGIIDGDARRARLYLKNWPARIVYDELDALFLDLARNETDKVPVRASVEVTSPINGKQATVPQLFIELADLTADSADAAQRAKRARLRDTPKDTTDRLLASDIETLTSALQASLRVSAPREPHTSLTVANCPPHAAAARRGRPRQRAPHRRARALVPRHVQPADARASRRRRPVQD